MVDWFGTEIFFFECPDGSHALRKLPRLPNWTLFWRRTSNLQNKVQWGSLGSFLIAWKAWELQARRELYTSLLYVRRKIMVKVRIMDTSAGTLLRWWWNYFSESSLKEFNLPQPEIRKWENLMIARDNGSWTWRNKYRPEKLNIIKWMFISLLGPIYLYSLPSFLSDTKLLH